MKGFIEEYGGIVVACIMGTILLGILALIMGDNGVFRDLIKAFFQGVGAEVKYIG